MAKFDKSKKPHSPRNSIMSDALNVLKDRLEEGAKRTKEKRPQQQFEYKGIDVNRFFLKSIFPLVADHTEETTILYLHVGDQCYSYMYSPSKTNVERGQGHLRRNLSFFAMCIRAMEVGATAYFGAASGTYADFPRGAEDNYDYVLDFILKNGQMVKITRQNDLYIEPRNGKEGFVTTRIHEEAVEANMVPHTLFDVHQSSMMRDSNNRAMKRNVVTETEKAYRKRLEEIKDTESAKRQKFEKPKGKKKALEVSAEPKPEPVEEVEVTDFTDTEIEGFDPDPEETIDPQEERERLLGILEKRFPNLSGGFVTRLVPALERGLENLPEEPTDDDFTDMMENEVLTELSMMLTMASDDELSEAYRERFNLTDEEMEDIDRNIIVEDFESSELVNWNEEVSEE